MTWHDLTTSKPCDVNAAVSSVWVSIDNWLESIMPDMSMTLSKPELSRQQKTTRIPHNSDFLTIWDTSNLSKCSQVVLDLAFVLWVYRHALHPSFTLDVIKPAEAWNIIWNTSMKAIERGESVQNDMHSFFKKCTPIRTSCFLNCSKRLRCFALVWMPQEWQHCLPHKVFNFFSVQTRASSDGPTFRKIAFVKILFRKICYINNIVRCDYYYFFLSVHWVSGWWGFTSSIPGARENVADVADVSCLTNDGPSVRAAGLSLNMKEIFNLFHKIGVPI